MGRTGLEDTLFRRNRQRVRGPTSAQISRAAKALQASGVPLHSARLLRDGAVEPHDGVLSIGVPGGRSGAASHGGAPAQLSPPAQREGGGVDPCEGAVHVARGVSASPRNVVVKLDARGARTGGASPLSPPSTPLETDGGRRTFADLRGKVRIVTLWAEWCAPCIAEMADLADLNRRAADKDFEVVALLTGSGRKLDQPAAKALLASHDAVLPVWAEPNGGATLLKIVAADPLSGQPVLPCTLIVDRRGRIRGRAFGSAPTHKPPPPGFVPTPGRTTVVRREALTEAEKTQMMATRLHTAWGTADGESLVAALKARALG